MMGQRRWRLSPATAGRRSKRSMSRLRPCYATRHRWQFPEKRYCCRADRGQSPWRDHSLNPHSSSLATAADRVRSSVRLRPRSAHRRLVATTTHGEVHRDAGSPSHSLRAGCIPAEERVVPKRTADVGKPCVIPWPDWPPAGCVVARRRKRKSPPIGARQKDKNVQKCACTASSNKGSFW